MNLPSATALLEVTVELMAQLRIPVRDTFNCDTNLDDFYTNGEIYGGPRQIQLLWVPTPGFASATANKKYEINGYRSIAYDSYKISVPVMYHLRGRHDPAIHEFVHFLQHQTKAEDDSYFQALPNDQERFRAYLEQRCEVEAHLVQVAYIAKDSSGYMQSVLDPKQEIEIRNSLETCGESDVGTRLQLVLRCKKLGLI